MAKTPQKPAASATAFRRKRRGFVHTGGLLGQSIRRTSEKRGFAESRLLTQWLEFAGPVVADIAQPVKVSYGQGGLGATLTLLTSGANAPMLQMQTPSIIERVNACYGYNAIRRIQITQTAASGFAEAPTAFAHKQPVRKALPLSPAKAQSIDLAVEDVTDAGLKQALALLGANVLAHPKNN
jgi:hypothetical protein